MKITDPDLLGVEPALRRAAKVARIRAAFHDSSVVYWKNGRVVAEKVSLREARRLQRELKIEEAAAHRHTPPA